MRVLAYVDEDVPLSLAQALRNRGVDCITTQEFVHWGIGKNTIWTEVRGQALLGEDDFVEKLADHLKKHKDVPEIPRSRRYSTRPSLAALLPDSIMNNHRKLMKKLSEAVEKYGYHQSELARHVAVHYSTISRWLREYENATKKT